MKGELFKLTDYGRELVDAMPDRKAVAAVKRKWARKKKEAEKQAEKKMKRRTNGSNNN